ncbi:hypothetical protein TIFTF001_036692 [Ficus carica]|uniref:Uncharacterized protein n=1 Tax=Ficus carica TaxID=3494 RepID=A0AA88E474_FICCA|nr:hypothetical protein TIFTF001_036692 [Ficus carica]
MSGQIWSDASPSKTSDTSQISITCRIWLVGGQTDPSNSAPPFSRLTTNNCQKDHPLQASLEAYEKFREGWLDWLLREHRLFRLQRPHCQSGLASWKTLDNLSSISNIPTPRGEPALAGHAREGAQQLGQIL